MEGNLLRNYTADDIGMTEDDFQMLCAIEVLGDDNLTTGAVKLLLPFLRVFAVSDVVARIVEEYEPDLIDELSTLGLTTPTQGE